MQPLDPVSIARLKPNVGCVRAVLVHGMGRTPLSMLVLAARLRRRGLRPVFFGYSVTFESFLGCTERLRRFIDLRMGGSPFFAVGHSLGTVLLRYVYPQLRKPPVACFFIAPPGQACRAARTLASPVPSCPTRVYAGNAGPTGHWSPFGTEPNDGILSVKEATIPGLPVTTVRKLHTFVMNAPIVADEIQQMVRAADLLPPSC
jgi:hypothetical protein